MHLWNGIIPLPSLALSMSSPGLPGPQEGLGLLLVALLPLALLLRRVLRKDSREALQQLQEAQHLARLGSWSYDHLTRKMTWSEEVWRILGLERGKSPASFPLLLAQIHPDDRARAQEDFLQGLASGGERELLLRLQPQAGPLKYVYKRCRTELDADGSFRRTLGTLQDVTELKRAEAEAQALAEALKHSHQELEQFSYSISHDMRQPLRMVTSYLKLLQLSLGPNPTPDQQECIGFAVEGAQRLDRMLLGLLEYSRVGRRGEAKQRVASRSVLEEVLLILGPAMREAQAQVIVEGDWPEVLVCPDEILRLLQNLLDNALKFRKPGVAPHVTVQSQAEGSDWLLQVTDQGIGILPSQAGRLFQVFQRLQSREDYEGTGIGLAICRKIVSHHGGSIRAESEGEGLGTTLRLRLPVLDLPR